MSAPNETKPWIIFESEAAVVVLIRRWKETAPFFACALWGIYMADRPATIVCEMGGRRLCAGGVN
ncbi:MAG TPA: hypothetical protein VHW03_10085 [Chthoniobacterales bacterium]|jgi:hypothetical protein|nr:hypothetical protein [Chthoniobacterales bacterium]